MTQAISGVLLLVAVIHLLPLVGALGAERLNALYGISLADSNIVLLMRHRAILFGLIGAFLACSAFGIKLQWLGLIAGMVSVSTFLLFARSLPNLTNEIERVVLVDWVALALLLVGIVLKLFHSHAS